MPHAVREISAAPFGVAMPHASFIVLQRVYVHALQEETIKTLAEQ